MISQTPEQDPEIVAISAVHTALKNLDAEAQSRVLTYIAKKLNVVAHQAERDPTPPGSPSEDRSDDLENEGATDISDEATEGIEGISPVAKKWVTRNGLKSQELSAIFSLGVDEIDLIAKTVPGKSKRERTRTVFLLKGIAAYLGTGVARFTHEQMKEACLHYDAFDAANFATHLKSISSEVSGNKKTGYTLTTRGLASATEMVKQLLRPDHAK